MADNWKIKGDFVLSCNCTVFCPCVISLGQHEPTEGRCQAWAGVRIDEGFHDDTDLKGVKAGLLINATRVAIVGQAVAPPLFDTMVVLGQQRVVRRLRDAVASFGKA